MDGPVPRAGTQQGHDPCVIRDLRVCFVGDSFVAGTGDPLCLGWAGRLAARTYTDGQPVTAYNLGVRRQTSSDILARWQYECTQRLQDCDDPRVVLSFGVNDTALEEGRPRVAPDESSANLSQILRRSADRGWPALVIAPPPVDDEDQNARIALLGERFARVCSEARVPYVPVHQRLRSSAVWRTEVRAGDGAHPGAGGYDEIAALIAPHWRDWLRTLPRVHEEAPARGEGAAAAFHTDRKRTGL
ncbi:GDSL-type esterase/lipase family protein [Streptomyces sp. WMMB 322]|uniref:GDSL-type esterase/lipase family protein n=1 Tax=Streptomyces sp. WMMB 322 TaxID=1286821 RepID=UPI00099E3A9F|nr:GDSL-type esterase/lipase family protein [Streptomyces sp. WMMB 322]